MVSKKLHMGMVQARATCSRPVGCKGFSNAVSAHGQGYQLNNRSNVHQQDRRHPCQFVFGLRFYLTSTKLPIAPFCGAGSWCYMSFVCYGCIRCCRSCQACCHILVRVVVTVTVLRWLLLYVICFFHLLVALVVHAANVLCVCRSSLLLCTSLHTRGVDSAELETGCPRLQAARCN